MDKPLIYKGHHGGQRTALPLRWAAGLAAFSCAVLVGLSLRYHHLPISVVSVSTVGTSFPFYPPAPQYFPPAYMPPPTVLAPPPAVQYPAVWNGDHVLSGSQREWAAEDAAQHALNLADWRIKLLQAKLKQAKLSKQVMSVGVHETHHYRRQGRKRSSQSQLRQMEHSVAALASETSRALKLLATKAGVPKRAHKETADTYQKKLQDLKDDTDRQLQAVMDKIDSVEEPKHQ